MTVTRYPEGATSLDGLGDVAVSTASRGQIIAHNGTLFRNRSQGVFDVRDWGVTGDGVTQDATAINALLASSTDGSVLRFPQGSYLVNSQLTYSGKKLTLVFEQGAKIKESGTFTTPILFLDNADGSVVRGLTVEGSESSFVGTDSTRYAVEVDSSDDVVIDRLTVTGKSRCLLLENCIRASVSRVRFEGLVTSAVSNVNYHTTVHVKDSRHCVVHDVRVANVGSAVLQAGTTPANMSYNVYSDIRGQNCYDNGIYLAGGYGCDVIGVVVTMDAGKLQTTGASAVKARGSRHRIIGGGAFGTYIGVALTGDGVALDGFGASGHGTTVTGFVAKDCRGPGFHATIFTGIVSDSPMRDFILQGCVADGCCADGEILGSVHFVGTIGAHLDGCKVINHAGHVSSSGAIMLAGNVSPLVTCKRNILTDCEVIWPDSAAPACRSVLITRADDTQIDDLTLVNTAQIGVDLSTATNRTRVRGTRGVNITTSAVTVNPGAGATDTEVELFEGMTWIDSGTTSRARWMGKRVDVRTTALTLASTNYDGIETVVAGDAASGYTITLPAIARSRGRRVTLKRTSPDDNITLDGNGAETIDGAATKRIDSQFGFITVVGGSTEWHVVASGGTIT